jgi:hypothetical protein
MRPTRPSKCARVLTPHGWCQVAFGDGFAASLSHAVHWRSPGPHIYFLTGRPFGVPTLSLIKWTRRKRRGNRCFPFVGRVWGASL